MIAEAVESAVARRLSIEAHPVAYIAAVFPLASETFVYREVRCLRQRGWTIHAVTLNDSPAGSDASFADLIDGRTIVYGTGKWRTIASYIAELFSHPLRSTRTLLMGLGDAICPGEKTPIGTRCKTIAQAMAGVGLARQLRRRKIGHIHCHFAHAPASVGMYAAAQLQIPFSFTGHANDLFQRRALLRRKLQRAEFVACISRWHRELYNDIVRDDGDRYCIIRCGVDIETWKPRAISAPASAPSRVFRVSTVCRLVEKKGVDTLLRAIAILIGRDMKVQLTIAGDGPDRERLMKIADELKLGDAARWLGAISNEKVSELLGESDVFALPCRPDARGDKDGIPVVLMEAMACGVPVIGGNLPAIAELIEDRENGFLVPVDDLNRAVEILAPRLAELWRDGDLRDRFAKAGRERVQREFSLAANVDRLEQRFVLSEKVVL